MQFADEGSQRGWVWWGKAYPVIVVRENRPGLQVPAILGSQALECLAEQAQTLRALEVMPFQVGPAGYHVSACFREPVHRTVRPIAHLSSSGPTRFDPPDAESCRALYLCDLPPGRPASHCAKAASSRRTPRRAAPA